MKIKVTFENKDTLTTQINGTIESVLDYYKIGSKLNIGTFNDNMQGVEKVQFYCKLYTLDGTKEALATETQAGFIVDAIDNSYSLLVNKPTFIRKMEGEGLFYNC